MTKELSPICLFVYNRIIELENTIDALKKNYLATESVLFIFSDGAKNETDLEKVNKVRNYIHSVSGFKTIQIIESSHHQGLADSIITGVSNIINQYNKVIVLEDDLVTSSNFLDFMNQGLDFYVDDQNIFNINGYSLDLKSLKVYPKDFYLAYRASSWGWGTWKDRWNGIDWKAKDYSTFMWNPMKHLKFMRGGSDMSYMLWKQMNGKIDSWAIRWCFHQFKNNQLSVVSSQSKVINIGINDNATNTKKTKRFYTKLELGEKRNFMFDFHTKPNLILMKEFKQQYSVFKRIRDRFITGKCSRQIILLIYPNK
jgi:hypothetical protein